MKKSHTWFYGISVGLMAVSLIGCERPPEQETTSDNKIVAEQPPLETTASDIAKEYADNAVAADNKFKDITFNVSGTIVDVQKNSINEPYVSLKGGVDPTKEPQFAFIVADREKAFELKPGQNVKLQCKGLGDLADAPMAGECKILE
ncbi:MAG: OB-fold protein [Methylophilus sp.]|uniref:OB-fold protein n=1 Tax=Methylophilus sp. TaxID=29541 RepID=UPI003FA027D9